MTASKFGGILQKVSLQFARSMTGHRSKQSISAFWKHCCKLDEWRSHPWLENSDDLGSIMVSLIVVENFATVFHLSSITV